ncbi:hypothetical protein [Levilactobacillus senmaizukei]|nr:hypothetical protein [Levilactobacillus senmaizukei]
MRPMSDRLYSYVWMSLLLVGFGSPSIAAAAQALANASQTKRPSSQERP